MPLITEAGWPQCSRDECDNPLVPGTRKVRIEVRQGDPATILIAFAAWWHRNVRSIEPRDGHRNWWGYSATNDVWNSNHLGGIACFAGDVEILTREGPRPIGELAGTEAEILTADPWAGGWARWVTAPIYSFGDQETKTITLSRFGRTKTIRATAEHRWFVRRVKRIEYRENGKRRTRQCERVEEVTTTELRSGDILTTSRPRRESVYCEPSPIGIAAGIVFGDGSVNDSTRPQAGAIVDLYGIKQELLKFFPQPRIYSYGEYIRVENLPRHFKTDLPSCRESTGYLLGWLAGMIATDGYVSEVGAVTLSTARSDVADYVRDLCPRLGIGINVTTHKHGPGAYCPDGLYYRLNFDRYTLDSMLFVRSDQRDRFGIPDKVSRWKVQSVEDGITEEVFCASVDITRSFVLDEFILTGNCDVCADELPWQKQTMPGDQIGMVRRGLDLFEGHVYWGGNWNRVDEMHFQMGGNTYNNPRTHEFAERLRNGYLNIYGPPDPLAFPLPPGYYYGPLEGPIESISGEHHSDSQIAKDSLGRWQEKLGLPVSKKWDDGLTPKAAATLQLQRGWEPNPLFGHGGVYEAEWDEVIRKGWRLPDNWDPGTIPDPVAPLTKWVDVSQYQKAHIDDSYPYEVVAFRASVADQTFPDPGSSTGYAGVDNKFVENMRRARKMVECGRLKKIIAYHFWVPGADNWGAFQKAIEVSGGMFPELACMLDLEDGGTKWNVRGDQTPGVKEWIAKAQAYFVNKLAVSIYINFNSNASLLVGVNDLELRGVKLIVPAYHGPDEPPYTPAGIVWFGHQYSDKETTSPFGRCDINQALMPLPMFLEAWGINGEVEPPKPRPELPPTVEAGMALIAEQFLS